MHYCWLHELMLYLYWFVLAGLTHVSDGYPSGESFDFIVVGGGVAGCTLASRLSESGRFSVLLLEIGEAPVSGLYIPAIGPLFNADGRYTKSYQTESFTQPRRTITYQVGRAMGGGSAVNGMVFNRGSPHDFNNWADLMGDPSWGYENMLEYFKRVENYVGDFPSDQHAYTGHVTVSQPRWKPGMETILQAGQFLGYPVRDPNGPQQISFTPIEFTKRWGRRVSSFSGYLLPYLGLRQNLRVVTGAKVDRILFDQTHNLRAVGVVYSMKGVSHAVYATKEIVLSAGVAGSPSILLKSGVGPKDVLSQNGIAQVKELPVGKNLHDHVIVNLQFMINDSREVLIPERDHTPENYLKYNLTGEGPYSTHDADNAQAFMSSGRGYVDTWPDIQIQFVNSAGSNASPPADILPGEVITSCMVYLSRPKSRGILTLNASDPQGDPILNFEYLRHPEDMEVLFSGIKQTLEVYEKTPAFQRLNARYTSVPVQECQEMKFRSREYWECHIRNRFRSGYHGGGTCRMGKDDRDKEAVVDTGLKVIGVEALRVVDTSVFPQITNANTQAPTYAVAEKAAAMILQRWDPKVDNLKRISYLKRLGR